MIDALIERASVTYKCYEMYAHRGKKVQLPIDCQLMFNTHISDICKKKQKLQGS
jgi:hypothetical protein